MKNLNQDRWSLGQDLNPGHPNYEAGVLNTQPRHLVTGDQTQDPLNKGSAS